jgi:DNA mismatch repair protein MutS
MEDKNPNIPSPPVGEGVDGGGNNNRTLPPTSILPHMGGGNSGVRSDTPLMQQYHDLKSRHPGEILFFRLGDFFELFGEDAKKCAPILEVTLTHRQNVPMCGVPAHSVEPYVAKLLKAGLRVAIADQIEDPALAKGLVKRNVVRVITAGTIQEETLLPAKRCNFLVALAIDKDGIGLAAIESSTGEFIVTEIVGPNASTQAWDEMMRLGPSEVILPPSSETQPWRERLQQQGIAVADAGPADFSGPMAEERLRNLFGTASLRGFGLENKSRATSAAGAAARYLENTQCGRPMSLRPPRTYELVDSLQMDAHTLDHLDVLPAPGASSGRPRSLLEVIDQTLTPMGGRLLRRWMVAPLRAIPAIQDRLDKVEFFFDGKENRRHLRAALQGWPDLERILTRLTANSASPRDLAALGQGLRRLPKMKSLLMIMLKNSSPLVGEDAGGGTPPHGTPIPAFPHPGGRGFMEFPDDPELAELLERSIVDGPPPTLKDGGVIREGYHAELDEIRLWIREGKNRLLELEKREREQTGIPSLKVGFNNVFGYFLEVTKTHVSKVPLNYVRKQTTANGERYITPELKEFETRILGAQERALRLESALVQDLREQILRRSGGLHQISQAVAELDVFVSLAEVAERRRYVKPRVDDSDVLWIREGRHPVLEEVLPSGTLVPNDVELNGSSHAILVLTGPNMSGKSTYLRQTALIAILAQMGSYVPAAEARIGVLDQLFTRIGASDRLTEGESTFMVEMVETARILHHATRQSLVILDEVGRGTSTYDGISIAWACLEHLQKLGPKVLFATHYFELTQLAQNLPGVVNAHVSARDWGDHVVFLHKVEPGPADRSFGIHVAKLAGVPKPVLTRAASLLQEFEKLRDRQTPPDSDRQPSLFPELPTSPGNPSPENDTVIPAWVEDLAQLDLNQMTPLEALLKLQEWKEQNPT